MDLEEDFATEYVEVISADRWQLIQLCFTRYRVECQTRKINLHVFLTAISKLPQASV